MSADSFAPKPNKERVYDELIAPLMERIIKTCEANGIAMFASFALPTPEHPELVCTTTLPDGDGNNPAEYKAALRLIMGDPKTLLKTDFVRPDGVRMSRVEPK